jgi:hypothetical protein
MRLIDADALKDMSVRYFYMPGDQNSHLIKQWMKVAINNCIALLDNAPTINAVEVVYCKDCKYRNTESCAMSFWELNTGKLFSRESDNGFCNYGKGKKNEID